MASAVLAASRGLEVDRVVLIAPPASPTRFADEFASKLHLDAEVVSALRSRVESRLKIPFSALDVPTLARGLRQELLVVHDEGDRDVSIELDPRFVDADDPANVAAREAREASQASAQAMGSGAAALTEAAERFTAGSAALLPPLTTLAPELNALSAELALLAARAHEDSSPQLLLELARLSDSVERLTQHLGEG